MFLSIEVFEDLCTSIFGKDLEKIRIPEMPQMIFIAMEVPGISIIAVHPYVQNG